MTIEADEMTKQLRERRLELGISQTEVGERCGIAQPHVCRIENGGINIRVATLVQMARALECELMIVPNRVVAATKAAIEQSSEPHNDSTTP